MFIFYYIRWLNGFDVSVGRNRLASIVQLYCNTVDEIYYGYLCRLQRILCLVQCSGNLEVSNRSVRCRPTSKWKNCGPAFSERAICLNVWAAKSTNDIFNNGTINLQTRCNNDVNLQSTGNWQYSMLTNSRKLSTILFSSEWNWIK